ECQHVSKPHGLSSWGLNRTFRESIAQPSCSIIICYQQATQYPSPLVKSAGSRDDTRSRQAEPSAGRARAKHTQLLWTSSGTTFNSNFSVHLSTISALLTPTRAS